MSNSNDNCYKNKLNFLNGKIVGQFGTSLHSQEVKAAMLALKLHKGNIN